MTLKALYWTSRGPISFYQVLSSVYWLLSSNRVTLERRFTPGLLTRLFEALFRLSEFLVPTK